MPCGFAIAPPSFFYTNLKRLSPTARRWDGDIERLDAREREREGERDIGTPPRFLRSQRTVLKHRFSARSARAEYPPELPPPLLTLPPPVLA